MDLQQLKKEIKKIKLPKELRLDNSTLIIDVELFVETQISFLETNKGVRSYLPYYERLFKCYNILKNNPNG